MNMVIGLARTKAMAILLGPAGVGLMGTLNAIADLARTLAELGINNSGVRQIAEAAGTADARRIAVTVTVLRRVAILLGLAGGLLLCALAIPVSTFTFGSEQYGIAVALLGLAVFFRLVADGQGALLQGLRRIGDIARVNVLGALFGTALAIVLVYWLREDGVAPAIVAVAACTLAVSWWYSRRVVVEPVAIGLRQAAGEARALLHLGLAFMTSALLTMGAAYVVRLILIREGGLEFAGLYQAAWAIGGLFVGFVLQAMGTDFYPRLVAAAQDDELGNRLVNEQSAVSLLMASSGVLATLTLAPWVVSILYSGEFRGATEVLRWICLGMALRVLTWPLGYILVAKGRTVLFVSADLAWTVVNIVLTWLCVRQFGLAGAGIAFFGSYVIHLLVVYPMCRHVSGFRWTATTAWIALAFTTVVGGVQVGFIVLQPEVALACGLAATLTSLAVSVWMIQRLVAPDRVPRRLAWLVSKLGASLRPYPRR